jgi:flagellar hook assembly protein FlgD
VISARFVVPREGPVRVTICDLAGHRVAVLQDGPLAAGEHEVRWDGQGAGGRAAAGAYVLVVDAPGGRLARKLLLLK